MHITQLTLLLWLGFCHCFKKNCTLRCNVIYFQTIYFFVLQFHVRQFHVRHFHSTRIIASLRCLSSVCRYQINAKTDLALRYKNVSPLENHHYAVALQILSNTENNIFSNLSHQKQLYIHDVRTSRLFVRLPDKYDLFRLPELKPVCEEFHCSHCWATAWQINTKILLSCQKCIQRWITGTMDEMKSDQLVFVSTFSKFHHNPCTTFWVILRTPMWQTKLNLKHWLFLVEITTLSI